MRINYEEVQTVAASKMRVLVNILQTKDNKYNNISKISLCLQQPLERILGLTVSIAPSNFCSFPQLYVWNDILHIRYPRLTNNNQGNDDLLLLCIGVVLACCPTDFVNSIDPHEECLHSFCSHFPELAALSDSLCTLFSENP